METRLALIGIVVENNESAKKSMMFYMNTGSILLDGWEFLIENAMFQ